MTHMNVKYCIGNEGISNRPLRPFSEEVLDFAAELSAALMQNEQVRKYPVIVSFNTLLRSGAGRQTFKKRVSYSREKGKRGLGVGLSFISLHPMYRLILHSPICFRCFRETRI